MAREDHWTYKLFVENAEMYLPALEEPEGEADGQVDALVELFDRQGLLEGGRVLDTACGIGRHSIRLAKLGYQMTGVDLSPLYVRKAEESATEEGHDARFLHADIMKIESLSQDAPPFDAVLVVLTINRDWVIGCSARSLQPIWARTASKCTSDSISRPRRCITPGTSTRARARK